MATAPNTASKTLVKKPQQRVRRVHSHADELLRKSQEAALSAVQIFNSPAITFKAETYVVLMIIAWTYLMHAYHRKIGVEYRYYKTKEGGTRKIFDKTKRGAYKYWELERCLNSSESPLDINTSNNLRFLIELRHEIEHQMTSRIDELLSARFQACCLNYNHYVKRLAGDEYGIDRHLSFSLQFVSLSHEHVNMLSEQSDLPKHISTLINGFDGALTANEFNSPQYAYRVLFLPKTVNHIGQADRVIEFIKADSEIAASVNREYAIVKETEKAKYLPSDIVNLIQKGGYPKFNMHSHSQLWKSLEAKKDGKQFGTLVAKTWYWYSTWLLVVQDHCKANAANYK